MQYHAQNFKAPAELLHNPPLQIDGRVYFKTHWRTIFAELISITSSDAAGIQILAALHTSQFG